MSQSTGPGRLKDALSGTWQAHAPASGADRRGDRMFPQRHRARPRNLRSQRPSGVLPDWCRPCRRGAHRADRTHRQWRQRGRRQRNSTGRARPRRGADCRAFGVCGVARGAALRSSSRGSPARPRWRCRAFGRRLPWRPSCARARRRTGSNGVRPGPQRVDVGDPIIGLAGRPTCACRHRGHSRAAGARWRDVMSSIDAAPKFTRPDFPQRSHYFP
jgi:hypothetical protein